jgi:hypothetical protein
MDDLVAEGAGFAPFTLADVGGEPVYWNGVAQDRRVVVLVLSESAEPDDTGPAWLSAARARVRDLAERDLIVLVIARDSGAVPEAADLPAPTFRVLRDGYGEETARLGGAPAFYLVGKDGAIKRAARSAPPLDELFSLIDSMPMRQAEMDSGR